MISTITCKRCQFKLQVDLHLGQLKNIAPGQAQMLKQCKRAGERNFAYDCTDLISALLEALEREAPPVDS